MDKRHNHHDIYADIEKIKSAFSDTAMDVRGKAGDFVSHSLDGVKAKTARVQNNVAHYTAKKPFKSLGIALLAGTIIGFLLRRRR